MKRPTRDGAFVASLAGIIFIPVLALCQATWTPPVPPTAGTPGKLVTVAGTGSTAINCTLTGNAVPATAINFACNLAGVTIPAFTLPMPSAGQLFAFTYQFNSGTNAVTTIVTLTPGTAGVAFQATVNGGAAVTGTF
jgi:hypothetical protein